MHVSIENPYGMFSVPVIKEYGNSLYLALKSTRTVSKKGNVYHNYEKVLEVMKNEKLPKSIHRFNREEN